MTITVTEEEFQCDSDCLCQPRKNTTRRGLKKKIIFSGRFQLFQLPMAGSKGWTSFQRRRRGHWEIYRRRRRLCWQCQISRWAGIIELVPSELSFLLWRTSPELGWQTPQRTTLELLVIMIVDQEHVKHHQEEEEEEAHPWPAPLIIEGCDCTRPAPLICPWDFDFWLK